MVKIAASILAADFGRLGEQVREAEQAGVDWIHVDVMDGSFVPNISFGPLIVEAVRRHTTLPIDVHLMIQQPSRYLADFVKAGATSLTVHVETCPHLHRDLQAIHETGALVGVTLNPATPASSLDLVIGMIDLALVMSVNPGFGGQRFIPSSVDKIAALRRAIADAGATADVSVDGGINARTAESVVRAGASVLVVGSGIFQHPKGVEAAVRELRTIVG